MGAPSPVLGIPDLDRLLAPSLPPGWMALAVGHSGASTSLIAKQFAQAGVGETPVRFYTTYERTEDVQAAFRDFGWSTDGIEIVNLAQEYYERVLQRELAIARTRERGLRFADLGPSHGTGEGPSRTFNLTSRLVSDLAALDGPFRLALDSLDFLLEVLEGASVMAIARQVRYRAQSLGGRALLVVQGEIHDAARIGLLQDLADIVVDFAVVPEGEAMGHVLTVRKVRNHPELTRSLRVAAGASGFDLVNPSTA